MDSTPNVTDSVPSGAYLPLSVTDWTPAEWASVILGAIMFFFVALCVLWLNFKRGVRYIKIMGVSTLNASFLCMLVYWIASLFSCKLIPQVASVAVCTIWNIWLNEGSITLLLSILILRFWRLHLLLIQQKSADASGWLWMWLPALAWSPFIIYAIVATALRQDGPVVLNNEFYVCYVADANAYTHIAHLILLGIVFLVLSLQLNSVRTQIWREFTQSIITFSVLAINIVLLVVIESYNYDYSSWGRALYAFSIEFSFVFILLSFIGKPVFDSIFRDEEASLEFENAIRNRCIIILTSESSASKIVNKFNSLLSKSSIAIQLNKPNDTEAADNHNQIDPVDPVDAFIRASQDL